MPTFIKLDERWYNIQYILKIEGTEGDFGVLVTMCDGESVTTDQYQSPNSLVRAIDRLKTSGISDTA